MLSRIKEIISTPILREWLFFKIKNRSDGQPKPAQGLPPYFDSLDYTISDTEASLTIKNYVGDVPLDGFIPKNFLNKDESQFSDHEDFLAGFRFKWIHELLSKNILKDDILELIIDSYGENLEFVDNAYTTAERISNIGLFLSRSNITEHNAKFVNHIKNDVSQILENFEYYGYLYTGNHLLNNCRGLIWASYILQSKSLAKLGFEMLNHEVKRVFSSDGMLIEGSSHYQFLVTRNVFESIFVLDCFNEFDLDELKEKLNKMANACLFFKHDNLMPYIGDISPDYNPSWFYHVPEVINNYLNKNEEKSLENASGWASNYLDKVSKLESSLNHIHDFLKIKNSKTSLFVHINHGGAPILTGHAHCDSGAPTVFHGGKEVLIDPGRIDYTSKSAKYLQSGGHNTIIINGRNPEELRRGVFGPMFLEHRFGSTPNVLNHGQDSLELELHSYKKYPIRRKYEITESEVILKYSVSGKGKCRIDIPLFLGEDYTKENIIYSKDNLISDTPNNSIKNRNIEYGNKIAINSLYLGYEVTLPWSTEIRIKL